MKNHTMNIKVGGEPAGKIRVKPITLIYDGTYGTQKIEIDDDNLFPSLDCRTLVSSYDQITEEVIQLWLGQSIFVYCWFLMLGGNVRAKKLAQCLPESRKDFEEAADNVKYMFAFLSAFLYRIIQAKGKPFRIQYPEIGLHPGIQANLGDLFIVCKDQSKLMAIAKLKGKGKSLLEHFEASDRCRERGL